MTLLRMWACIVAHLPPFGNVFFQPLEKPPLPEAHLALAALGSIGASEREAVAVLRRLVPSAARSPASTMLDGDTSRGSLDTMPGSG